MTGFQFKTAALLSFAVPMLLGCRASNEAPRASLRRPNIVLIYMDDVDSRSLVFDWDQPNQKPTYPAFHQIASSGVQFTNFHVTTPVCGPSRACLLTGQYAHRNRVRVNRPEHPSSNGFSGGYRVFDPDIELANWLKATGFSTAFVGKYLHDDFDPSAMGSKSWMKIRPKGWHEFRATLGSNYVDFLYFDGRHNELKQCKDQYRTDFETTTITNILKTHFGSTKKTKPLFLCWAPLACHESVKSLNMPAERHLTWQPPLSKIAALEQSDGEQDWQNAPSTLSILGEFSSNEIEEQYAQRIRRHQTLKALDENLQNLRNTLKSLNQLDNTIFIITSDHGFEIGEHRHVGKRLPYDPVTKVPCLVSGSQVEIKGTNNTLLANIDLFSTILELASSPIPPHVDGRSFAKVLRGEQTEPIHPDGIILENWEVEYSRGHALEAAYTALRERETIYTEWASGDREFYDLRRDPDQRNNLYPFLTENAREDLSNRLRELRNRRRPPEFANQIRLKNESRNEIIQESIRLMYNEGAATLSGFVESDAGIKRIEMEIKNQDNEFWDGFGWSTKTAKTTCETSSRDGHISKWKFNLAKIDFSSINSPETKLEIRLFATDRDDHTVQCPKIISTTINLNEPATKLVSPVINSKSKLPIRIYGIARDNTRVSQVVAVIIDPRNGLHWDGNDWVKKYSRHKCRLIQKNGGMTHFEKNLEIPDYHGPLYISARAIDDGGVFDRTVAEVTIDVLDSDDQ